MITASHPESVLIVGSGIVGIACAHYLSKQGLKVTVIDRGMKKHLARLAELEQLVIVAGHVGENALEPHPKSTNVTKLQVSKFVHFGTARMRARPYIDLAIQDVQSSPKTAKPIRAALRSRKDPSARLKPIGKRVAKAIRDAIVAVDAVDTGATRDAVRYQIRKGAAVLQEGAAVEKRGPRVKSSAWSKRKARAKKSVKRAYKRTARALKRWRK